MTGGDRHEPPGAELEVEIRSLTAAGRLEEGEARYREQAPSLDDAGAVAAAGAVIEGWQQAGQLDRGARFLREFQAARPAALTVPLVAEVHVGFHNTVGNLLRQLGQQAAAQAEYQLAADRLGEVGDPVRWRFTVMANAAFGLREMHAYRVAIQLLTTVAGPEMPGALRAAALADIAHNLRELGETEAALAAAKRALEVLGPPAAALPRTHETVLAALAAASGSSGDLPLALSTYRELADQASRHGDPAAEARALVNAAKVARRIGDETWRALAADAAARLAEAHARGAAGGSNLDLDSVQAGVLGVLGDLTGLDRMVRATGSKSLDVLEAIIELRGNRGEIDHAGSELQAAWTIVLEEAFKGDEIVVSDVERLRSVRSLRRWAVAHAFQVFDSGADDRFVLLTAAELQSSLLAGYLAWPTDARESPVRILDPGWLLDELQGAALVFAVQGDRNLRVGFTRGGREEVLVEWDGFELDRARDEVEATTRRTLPGGNPLARSERWNAFAGALGAALGERVRPGDHVVFSLGYVLDGLPLHVVPTPDGPLGRRVSCSYIASLYQLAGIRARAKQMSRQPERAGVVSVWRTRDLDRTRQAFENGALEFARLLRDHGFAVETLTGSAGTVAATADLLSRVDILFLACHGVGGSDGRHGFLLAGEGQLPPMFVRQPPPPGAPRFLLSWDELPEATAPLVVSAACASSSGSMSPGGERVSLDRALLAAGTRTFVGPLWDVSVEDTMAFSVDIARRFLGGQTWAEAWRQAVDNCAASTAPASWQSFILIGDWR